MWPVKRPNANVHVFAKHQPLDPQHHGVSTTKWLHGVTNCWKFPLYIEANIKVPRSQEEREASPVPQGNLHGVPDTMLPIVLVHRLPSTLLDKLDKENSGHKTGLQGVKGTPKVTGKKRATSNGGVVRRAKSAIMKPLVVKLFKDRHSKMVETDSQECWKGTQARDVALAVVLFPQLELCLALLLN